MKYEDCYNSIDRGINNILEGLEEKLSRADLRKLCNSTIDIFEKKIDELDKKEQEEIDAEYNRQMKNLEARFSKYCDFMSLAEEALLDQIRGKNENKIFLK